MTILQKLGQANASIENENRVVEFARAAQFIMAKGGTSNAALAAERSSREGNLGPRLADIIKYGTSRGGISREALLQQKTAVVAGGLTGSPLADYSAISAGFINSLVNASVFDAMVASMVPVPLGTGTVGAVLVGAAAYSLGEGSSKPISGMSIANQPMTPMKSHCAVVITDELARSPLVGSTQLIARELRNAVAKITDAAFIAAITAGVPITASLGTTPDAVRQTIATLLTQVSLGQGSAPYLITTPGNLQSLVLCWQVTASAHSPNLARWAAASTKFPLCLPTVL